MHVNVSNQTQLDVLYTLTPFSSTNTTAPLYNVDTAMYTEKKKAWDAMLKNHFRPKF